MNLVLTFLAENWERLGLERFGTPSRLSCVVATPRFRASSHVIFFILADEGFDPILVAKVPRQPGDNARLDRETMNLREIHAARCGGFDSIPRVVAYEDFCDHRLLIETAVDGWPMNRALVRRDTERCIHATIKWLIDLHAATKTLTNDKHDWFEWLIQRPFAHFRILLPLSTDEERLVDQTLELASSLHGQKLPLVAEHGDLSHPNILLSELDGVGVVDWELAEPRGLPAVDLFFYLTYVAFARRRARKNTEYLAAFHKAFFEPTAWARRYVHHYCEQFQLSAEMLTSLFVLCWSRYVAGLVIRLQIVDDAAISIDNETVGWLRSNRFYALWRHTIAYLDELKW